MNQRGNNCRELSQCGLCRGNFEILFHLVSAHGDISSECTIDLTLTTKGGVCYGKAQGNKVKC